MISQQKSYELIKFEDGDFCLDVKVAPNEDTVWLTQDQIAVLFGKAKSTINEHIRNILHEELDEFSVSRKFGKTELSSIITKPITYYNLDVILAVGYRVNSKRGIQFRRWATSILKEYLLKGHVVNEERCLSCTSNILDLQNKYNAISNKVKEIEDTVYLDNNKLIYEGEILEPYTFLRKLFFLAKKEIIIADSYADEFLITLLKDIKVNITIITSAKSYLNNTDIPNNIKTIKNDDIHGRYIFIDEYAYVMDHSFNAIGKKRFVIVKLESITKEMILKGII